MKNITQFLFGALLTLGLGAGVNAQTTLYSEDFEGTSGAMPAGITLINADALTPATGVAVVSNAWVLDGDATDSFAVSTSWYTPAGTSNDWLITPAITGLTASTFLSWEAMAVDASFPDGYEVWLTTSIAGATPVVTDFTTSGTRIFNVAAEQSTWTSHTEALGAYVGSTVYLAFRNNSTDNYLLYLDDISVVSYPANSLDLQVASAKPEYTLVPFAHAANLTLEATVFNQGPDSVGDAMLTCNVYNVANLTTPISVSSSATGTGIGSSATALLNAGTFTPADSRYLCI